MATDLSSLSGFMPDTSTMFSTASSTLMWGGIFLIVFIFLAVCGVAIYFLVRYMQYNKIIEIYEERNGFVEWVGEDRAREITYNILGDSVFVLRKRKKYLPRGTVKVSRNRYIYIIREDGEWVNVGLETYNNKFKELSISLIHPDMRAFKSGLQKTMRERYEKKSFLKEYAPILIPLIAVMIICVCLYFVVSKVVASQDNLNKGIEASDKVMEKAKDIIAHLDNICTNSGMVKVGGT